MKPVHFSGGVRYRSGKYGVTMMSPDFPACCTGSRARVGRASQTTNLPDVTCKACLKALTRADAYAEECRADLRALRRLAEELKSGGWDGLHVDCPEGPDQADWKRLRRLGRLDVEHMDRCETCGKENARSYVLSARGRKDLEGGAA